MFRVHETLLLLSPDAREFRAATDENRATTDENRATTDENRAPPPGQKSLQNLAFRVGRPELKKYMVYVFKTQTSRFSIFQK